ncbi:hypothetical protein BDN72DRAFT_851050, partial [Pluteus cervinus]
MAAVMGVLKLATALVGVPGGRTHPAFEVTPQPAIVTDMLSGRKIARLSIATVGVPIVDIDNERDNAEGYRPVSGLTCLGHSTVDSSQRVAPGQLLW